MAARSLSRTILEAHRAGAPGEAALAPGVILDVRPDQVLAGGVAAVVALAGFEALRLPRIAPEVAVVGAERHDPAAAFEAGAELRDLQESATRAGALFVRPGEGRCELVHLERLAAPGRVLLITGRRAPLAGSLGMVVIPCGALEVAAALAGRAVERPWGGVLGIRLEDACPSWADGHDVACALIDALGPGAAADRSIEFGGPGVASVAALARVAIAREIERLGSPAALFPSDDVTRGFLAATGRDSDWRRLDTGDLLGCDRLRSFSLATIEPMTLGIERTAVPRPIREDRGLALGAVLIGSAAGAPDLARLARAMKEGGAARPETLWIAPGSRRVRESAEALGVLATLREAGAQIIEGGMPPTPATSGLAYGALASDLPAGRTRWRIASLATCARAAIGGTLEDPRESAWPGIVEQPEPAFSVAEALRITPPEGAGAVESVGFPIGRPLSGPLHGPVLVRLGDRVTSDQVLPWGARVRSLVNDFAALSEHAFGGVAPDFAARARAAGGGFVVAGEQFGEGEAWDTAALVLVRLGVRAVLAGSIGRDFERLLALAGVLPLRWTGSDDGASVEAGDELEIPGLPETFIAGRPLVIRNLTRGTQYTLRHALSARDVERLRHGGLLADLAAR